jgi:tRNA pseudouridine13 synthase
MSTSKLLTVLAASAKCEVGEIGYAGLKDKSATTIQYISLPKKYEKELLKNLDTPRVNILEKTYHKSPIKIGALKGNSFKIVLHNVDAQSAKSFDNVCSKISKYGIPNYFGYQRFGEDSRSHLQGKEIAHSGKRLKGAREKLLVSSYQSYLFNQWLSYRVEISKTISNNPPQKAATKLEFPQELVQMLKKQPQFFKLFIGEVMSEYPYGKEFFANDINKVTSKFAKAMVVPTGLLCGDRVQRAKSDARYLEERYDDNELTTLNGDRRFAWIYPKALKTHYHKKAQELTVEFFLPKGSYATTLLEEIGKLPLL